MLLSKKRIMLKKKRKVRSNKGKKRGPYKKKTGSKINRCLIMDLDGNYHEINEYPGDDFIHTHLMIDRHIPIEYFRENEPEVFQKTYNNYINFCKK